MTDEFDLTHLIQTQAAFSYANAVMDRIGGWIEEGRIKDGGKKGWWCACGSTQRQSSSPDQITLKPSGTRKISTVEATNWVYAKVQDNHDWISGVFMVLQEIHFLK